MSMADRGRDERQTVKSDRERIGETQERSELSSRQHHKHHRQRERSPRPRSRSPTRENHQRKRGRSDSPKRSHRRSRSRSRSRRRSRSRDKKHHSHRNRKRSRSSSSSERHRKERKRQKKKDKKANEASDSTRWGRYGVISDADMHDKDPEFRTWLVEERIINPEVLSSDQLKKLFKEFAEDYNTATLPHEKYYDMHAYEKRMTIIRGGESNLLEGLDTYDPNADILSHKRVLKRGQAEKETFLTRRELEDLRRVQIERDQMAKMKLLGMNVDSKTGVRMDTVYDG